MLQKENQTNLHQICIGSKSSSVSSHNDGFYTSSDNGLNKSSDPSMFADMCATSSPKIPNRVRSYSNNLKAITTSNSTVLEEGPYTLSVEQSDIGEIHSKMVLPTAPPIESPRGRPNLQAFSPGFMWHYLYTTNKLIEFHERKLKTLSENLARRGSQPINFEILKETNYQEWTVPHGCELQPCEVEDIKTRVKVLRNLYEDKSKADWIQLVLLQTEKSNEGMNAEMLNLVGEMLQEMVEANAYNVKLIDQLSATKH